MSYPSPHDPFGQQQPPHFPNQLPNQLPSPGGYYVPPEYDARYGIRPPQTSGLALCSLIGGIVSFATCWFGCCCFLSPLVFASSVTSILLGHLALNQIHHSMGSRSGRELAWIGLGLAYPAALVSACFIGFIAWAMIDGAQNGGAATQGEVIYEPGEEELDEAVDTIAPGATENEHGNTDKAIELAKIFNERMKKQRDQLAADNPEFKIEKDDGEFVTWCELRDGRAAFVVYVPEYRTFSDEGKVEIEKRAWSTAQEVLREKGIPEGTKLGVGTKGLVLWGSVMTGKTVAEGSEVSGIERESKGADPLYPFFADEEPDEMELGEEEAN